MERFPVVVSCLIIHVLFLNLTIPPGSTENESLNKMRIKRPSETCISIMHVLDFIFVLIWLLFVIGFHKLLT